jgi:hypothetical protein
MNLEQLQRTIFDVIRQPLTADERMQPCMPDGRPTIEIAASIIKPNEKLTSAVRLEIYNRVYWFRILSALGEDFPGLRAVIGQKRFDAVLQAYLSDCPSESFTLRNLGARLESWLCQYPELIRAHFQLALDMVRLEWAEVEAFDSEELPKVRSEDMQTLGENPVLTLQPYLRLLDLSYPVDELLLRIRDDQEQESDFSSNVVLEKATLPHAKRWGLPKTKRTYLAVHRQENVVYFKQLNPVSFALLNGLRQGKTLAEAIQACLGEGNRANEALSTDLKTWFSHWAFLGWFCRPSRQETK